MTSLKLNGKQCRQKTDITCYIIYISKCRLYTIYYIVYISMATILILESVRPPLNETFGYT